MQTWGPCEFEFQFEADGSRMRHFLSHLVACPPIIEVGSASHLAEDLSSQRNFEPRLQSLSQLRIPCERNRRAMAISSDDRTNGTLISIADVKSRSVDRIPKSRKIDDLRNEKLKRNLK
jgi:hypothetical protein